MYRLVCGLLMIVGAGLAGAWAQEPVVPPPAETVITDVDGKVTKLANAKLTTGTRRIGWLADPKGTTPDEKLGPQVFEVREPNSTTLAKGVITLVPVASVESAKYDYEKLSVNLAVKGLKDPIQGTLQYKGINTIGLAGTADGKATTLTAGVLGKAAVKSVIFPKAVPLPASKAGGVTWAVQIVHPAANNPTVKARNLKALYQFGTVEQLVDGLPVRKGMPIPFDAKLTRFEMLANDPNTNFAAAEIETGAGNEKLIAIPLTLEQDKLKGTLVGLVGEVEAGYKIFPLHTIKVIVPLGRKAD